MSWEVRIYKAPKTGALYEENPLNVGIWQCWTRLGAQRIIRKNGWLADPNDPWIEIQEV